MIYSYAGGNAMKLPTDHKFTTLGINTFTLTGISLLWGQMLGLINPWFTILTTLCIIIGFGSEVNMRNEINNTTTNNK